VTKYQGECSGKCDVNGVVVCNGAVQAFVDGAKAALDWVRQHVTYTADFSASCQGNECTAKGSASASTKCSMSPGGSGEGLIFGFAALAAASFIYGRRRKR
jgi:hypothetical protein